MSILHGGEVLSAADSAWLRMERPGNPMCITAMLAFDGPLDFERLRATVEARLLRHARFRQRVREPVLRIGRGCWEDDPRFALDDHLLRSVLPAPGDDGALRAMVSALMSRPLDRARPLWQFHVIDGHEGGSVIVARIHHCLGDGVALVRVLLSLADEEPSAGRVGRGFPPPGQEAADAAPVRPAHPPSEIPALPAVPDGLHHHGLGALAEQALALAIAGASDAMVLGKLLLMPSDPPSALKRSLGGEKRAAWSEPLPLDEMQSIGRVLGGTVNDVLVAATAGALRRYLGRGAGAHCPSEVRAIVPVDLRPREAPFTLGNRFGLVYLPLPLGTAEPARRLHEVKARMDAIKMGREAVVTYAILEAVGAATPVLEDKVLDVFASKGSLVLSNVPGPRARLGVAGRALRTLMFWVPQGGDIGLGVSLVSYAGEVRVGVAADAAVVPDVEALIDAFREEFAALAERAGESQGETGGGSTGSRRPTIQRK